MFFRVLTLAAFGLLTWIAAAQAACSSYPYTLTNGTIADASQVMADFNCAALTSGSTIQNALLTGTTSVGSAASYSTGGLDIVAPFASLVVSQPSSTSYAGMRVYNDLGSEYRDLEIDYAGSSYTGSLTAGGPSGESAAISVVGNYPLALATSNTMRITITGGGNVGIATASPAYTLHVNGSVAGTSAYVNLSDARLKKNVMPLAHGLALVMQLQPVRFEWRSEKEREVGGKFHLPGGKQVGFIAQDLAKVLPEAVSTAKGKDAIMSVAESKVVPVLVSAVQELKTANDNRALEITRLEAQVAMLQHKLGMQSAQR